jgi:hypothetical protein
VPYTYRLGAYEFQFENASIVFCPAIQEVTGATIGPLLLPIVPLPDVCLLPGPTDTDYVRKKQEAYHSVIIGIYPKGAQVELDFSKLKLQLTDGKALKISAIATLLSAETACFNPVKFGFLKGAENLLGKQITITDSRIFYRVIYDAPADGVSGLFIDVDTIKINGKEVKLPPIQYQKNTKYYYVPFILPLPS